MIHFQTANDRLASFSAQKCIQHLCHRMLIKPDKKEMNRY